MQREQSYPERRYRKLQPDGHWFDESSMKFFNSRIGAHRELNDGRLAFISSEKGPSGPRMYAVRIMNTEGDITGGVGQYQTRGQAVSTMRKLPS